LGSFFLQAFVAEYQFTGLENMVYKNTSLILSVAASNPVSGVLITDTPLANNGTNPFKYEPTYELPLSVD